MIPKHLSIALEEIGQSEIMGDNDNPRISLYLETVGMPGDDEIPWCSAFVNWCLIQADINGTYKANARSWLDWGKPIEKPKIGDIVVFWRGSPNSYKGHVAFFLDMDNSYIYVIGGNQNNRVSVTRYTKKRLLGFRSVNYEI